MADKRDDRSPLNIPAGSSPITQDTARVRDEPLSGDKVEDYKKAVSQINVVQDFKDMTKWPCTRNSLLYGIMSGTGIGSVRFLGSRSPLSAANWAVATFTLVSIASWQVCQNARAKELAQMRMIQERYPHRHVSNLKRPQEDWTPPPGSSEPRAV